MLDQDSIFAFPVAKAASKNACLEQPRSKDKKSAMVLDMGEASREEGFRLYGCR